MKTITNQKVATMLLLISSAIAFIACKTLNISFLVYLPVQSVDSVLAASEENLGQPVQLFGTITEVDQKRRSYRIDGRISAELGTREFHPQLNEEVVVRGYLKKSRKRGFYLTHTYYNPSTLKHHREEVAKLKEQRSNR